jgi:putative NADPH-quinone reductase
MANSVSNLLIVLASATDPNDQRLNLINKYCKSFAQVCTNNGINVDIIDLYNENQTNLCNYLKSDDSKILEYQIRITKADSIVFFHPVLLDSIPSILKGFLENVFCSGFAYKVERHIIIGLLNKKAIVFAFDEKSAWNSKVISGDQLSSFWNKSIFSPTGLKGNLNIFYKFRSLNIEALDKIKIKIDNAADQIQTKAKSLNL